MPARIVIRGRSNWSSPELRKLDRERSLRRRAIPMGRPGTPREGLLVGAAAIPPDSPASPFRAGEAYECPEDQVTYRMVRSLDPRDGWATTGFWQKRWKCKHVDVLSLVRRGLLDAAMEQGSQVRRYRCRDERLVLKSPVIENEHRRREAIVARFKSGKNAKKKEQL